MPKKLSETFQITEPPRRDVLVVLDTSIDAELFCSRHPDRVSDYLEKMNAALDRWDVTKNRFSVRMKIGGGGLWFVYDHLEEKLMDFAGHAGQTNAEKAAKAIEAEWRQHLVDCGVLHGVGNGDVPAQVEPDRGAVWGSW